MGNARFSDDFKQDAVHQITVRGYPVKEVSQRFGVSTHSLYSWVKKYSKPSEAAGKDDHAAENRRLKRELARVTKERDILKKATVYFARDTKWSMHSLQSIAHCFPSAPCAVFCAFTLAVFMRG